MKNFKNVDLNIASKVLYLNFTRMVMNDENGNIKDCVVVPRDNLGDNVVLTVTATYTWDEMERWEFIDIDNIIYVHFDGINQSDENRFWKIDYETFSRIEGFLKDCDNI